MAGAFVELADARVASLEAKVIRIQSVRDQYARQAKFADHEPAAYFYEFVRRIDAALKDIPDVTTPAKLTDQ